MEFNSQDLRDSARAPAHARISCRSHSPNRSRLREWRPVNGGTGVCPAGSLLQGYSQSTSARWNCSGGRQLGLLCFPTSAIAPAVVQHVPVVPPAPKPAPKRLVIPKIPVPKPNKTSSKAPRRTAPAAGAAIGLPKKRGRKDSTTTPVLPPAPIALKRPVAAGAVSRKAPALSQQHHTAHPPPSSGEDSDEDESSADDDSDDEGAGTGLPEGYLALPPTEMRPAGSFGDDGSDEGSEEDDLDMLASSINSSLAGRPSTPSRKNSLVSSSGRRKSSVSTATQRGTPASKRPAVHDSPSGMGVARDARQGAMSLNRMMGRSPRLIAAQLTRSGSDAPTPEAKRRLEREADVADSSEEE